MRKGAEAPELDSLSGEPRISSPPGENKMIKDIHGIKACREAQGVRTIEIPIEDFEFLLKELIDTHNLLAEVVRDAAMEKPRELARTAEKNAASLKAEIDPLGKLLKVNGYIRQMIAKVKSGVGTRAPTEEHFATVVRTKIQARALQLMDYILGSHFPSGIFSIDSKQARMLVAGKEGEEPSRRDIIRVLWRAKKLWPSLDVDHRPNDPRGTIRATLKEADRPLTPLIDVGITWQRSRREVTLSL